MGRLLPLATVVSLLLLLCVVPAADAASDRAAARSFGAAANVFAKRARAALPASLIATQQASLDCHLAGVRRARAAGAPPAAIIRASLEGLALARSLIYLTAEPHLKAFVKRLDRVRTTDRALRSGRAAWRAQLKSLRVYLKLSLPPDVCEQVDAWVARGGTGAVFPDLDFTSANRELRASAAEIARETRIDRAAARMRALGQSRTRTRRFTVGGGLARQIEIEQRIVGPYGLSG